MGRGSSDGGRLVSTGNRRDRWKGVRIAKRSSRENVSREMERRKG